MVITRPITNASKLAGLADARLCWRRYVLTWHQDKYLGKSNERKLKKKNYRGLRQEDRS